MLNNLQLTTKLIIKEFFPFMEHEDSFTADPSGRAV